MPEPITAFRGAERVAMPGCFGVGASWRGFTLAQHATPPGEYGDPEYPGNFIAVDISPLPHRTYCKIKGVERRDLMVPGMILTCPPHEPICSLRMEGNQRLIALAVDPYAMESALPEPFSGHPVELIFAALAGDTFIGKVLSAMVAELEAGAPGGELLFSSLASSVALYAATRYAASPLALPSKSYGLGRARLARVLEYIGEHLASDLTLDELAGVAFLSSYHFGRMFKLSTGSSVHQFVLCKRIERAKEILSRTESSLAEISAAVGFSSQSQFTTAFRRVTRETPGAWRLASSGLKSRRLAMD